MSNIKEQYHARGYKFQFTKCIFKEFMLRFLGRIAIKSLGIGQIDLRYILIFKKIISIQASSLNIRRQYSIVQLTTCTHMGLARRGQD